jgi:UDP-glucuronate 4-epimerase
MVYLVTGAAGFIASRVCELLLADGHALVGVDNLNDYYDSRLKDYRLGRLLGEGERVATVAAGDGMSRFAGTAKLRGNLFFHALDLENMVALDFAAPSRGTAKMRRGCSIFGFG